jgi:phosphatidylglycerophosphatase A
VSLAFVPFELGWIVGAFLAFRVLDIFKPPPIRWVERHAKGSLGVMGDDLVAGLMAGAALWSVHRAFG